MSNTFEQIKALVTAGNFEVSRHAFRRTGERASFHPAYNYHVADGEVVNDYPHSHEGPSVLVLQHNPQNEAFHAVWGIRHQNPGNAVLVTAYWPDADQWSDDLRRRRR